MGTNKTISFEQMDKIVFLREKGLSPTEAANITGVSPQTVYRTMIAYNAAKDGNKEDLNRLGQNYVEWAGVKFGIKPEEPEAKPPKAEPKNDNTAQAVVALLNCINDLTAAIERIDNRLSAMQMTQQGFRSDATEAAKKIIEAVHVEGDILTKEHEKMIDLLGGIKMNTRKKQWQGGQE